MGRGSDRESLLSLLAPVAAEQGLELEDVTLTPAGKRRLLRVIVDRDGGVGLDEVAAVSTAVSAALDSSAAMGSTPYVLEVSSPGVDRPLQAPRHWRRARGRLVTATLADGGTVRGRVLGADEAGVDLDVEGTTTRLAWPALARGRVEVEFTRTEEGS